MSASNASLVMGFVAYYEILEKPPKPCNLSDRVLKGAAMDLRIWGWRYTFNSKKLPNIFCSYKLFTNMNYSQEHLIQFSKKYSLLMTCFILEHLISMSIFLPVLLKKVLRASERHS